jgi:phage-related protein
MTFSSVEEFSVIAVLISNSTDSGSRLTGFTGLSPNSTIRMNADIGMVSSQQYSKFSKKNFIRLLDGRNSISIIGDVTKISFEWSNRRYL